ncbi:hypothetical protein PENTCL1PPCAC_99, partial [Pristionchus entomophagus]
LWHDTLHLPVAGQDTYDVLELPRGKRPMPVQPASVSTLPEKCGEPQGPLQTISLPPVLLPR